MTRETNPSPKAVQQWPAVMNSRTVWEYLDCPSPHYRRVMKGLLLAGGYDGFKERKRFHSKSEIDAALGLSVETSIDMLKKKMMEAAKE